MVRCERLLIWTASGAAALSRGGGGADVGGGYKTLGGRSGGHDMVALV